MAAEAATILDKCHPIEDFVSGVSYLGICKSLDNGDFQKAGEFLDCSAPPFQKNGLLRSFEDRHWIINWQGAK